MPYPLNLPPDATRDGKFLAKLLEEASAKLKSGDKLVIAVDALDEVDQTDHKSSNILYLPVTLPKGVYFVLTQRLITLPLNVSPVPYRFDLMQYQAESLQDIQSYIRTRTQKSPQLRAWINGQGLSVDDFVTQLGSKSENNSGGVGTKDIRKHLDSLVWEDRNYALKHLPKHMVEASRFDQLYQWLTDFDWIEAKVGHPEIKIQELIEDYDLALNADVVLSGEQERVLRLIQGALRLSVHILAEDKTQLVEQLLGRFGYFDVPEIQKILEIAKQRKNYPWLRFLKPNLTPPGGALLRTLAGHSNFVNAVAVTPDGKG